MKYVRKALLLILTLALLLVPVGACGGSGSTAQTASQTEAVSQAETESVISSETPDKSSADTVQASGDAAIDEDGTYTSKDEVALYIHPYGKLPSNYITKQEAEDLGWDSSKGNLWDVADGMSIGGSRFGNYEGLLPEADGRQYYECDIDYEGGYRNAERIIYSNDGLIFYTDDHYKTFEQLY